MAQPHTTETAPRRESRTERRSAARTAAKIKPERSGKINPLALPLCCILLLACFCLLPRVNSNPALLGSFAAATLALGAMLLWLLVSVRNSGRALASEFVPNRVHYVQLVMHSCIFTYWGFYWREVYHEIPLILSQVVFLYALDMMVCWFRRDKWMLGFGPFPIVFSTNLFLWFHDDWFWLQFLMIATIVLFKEFVRWERGGKRVHIFNPSASALFLFSMVLIVANATQMSFGPEIAVTMEQPPLIFLELFLLSLVVQGLFSVTLVTLSSVAVMYVFGLIFNHATGAYYFIDTNIPPAVFLGSILLVTDPATSPRRMTGKILFGALYGAAVIALYEVLQAFHGPQFYDKLLCVPILNLTVRVIERWNDGFAARFHSLHLLKRWGPVKLNFAHMAIWISLFAVMWFTAFIGRGLWLKAPCENDDAGACLAYGKLMTEGNGFPMAKVRGAESFGRACNLGLSSACDALASFVRGGGLSDLKSACDRDDPVACFLSGWVLARGMGTPRDDSQARPYLEKACSGGFAPACAAGNGDNHAQS